MLSVAIGAALMVAVAPSAMADPTDFIRCDGDLAPTAMTAEKAARRGYLGIAERAKAIELAPGARGLASCDAALADPLLLPGYWLRRSTLLRARAVHLIALDRNAEALEALAASDAAAVANSNVLFADSIGLGNQVLRAIALRKLDRTAESAQLFEKVASARSYSPSIVRLVRSAQLYVEPDRERREALAHVAGRLEPRFFLAQFWFALAQSRFAAAETFSNQISFDTPRQHWGWTGGDETVAANDLLERRGTTVGAIAYLRTALGRSDAMAGVADLRAEIAEMRAPVAIPTPTKAMLDRQAANASAADLLEKALAPWERAIELRAALKGKNSAAALPLVEAAKIEGLPVFSDLLRQLTPSDAVDRAQIEAAIVSFDRMFAKVGDNILTPELKDIVKALPRPEFASNRPRIKGERGLFAVIMIGDDNNGYKVSTNKETGVVDVRFGSQTATPPMVEEAALLVAASHARRNGADGLVLTSTQLFQRTTRVTSYFGGVSQYDAGWELRLTMRLVDSTRLPADLAGNEWRVLNVADVIDRLGPVYQPQSKR